jgi:hypothetical protein
MLYGKGQQRPSEDIEREIQAVTVSDICDFFFFFCPLTVPPSVCSPTATSSP